MDKELIYLRIGTIIKHIDSITSDLKDKNLEEFKKSDLYVRATCFSLMQIGGRTINSFAENNWK